MILKEHLGEIIAFITGGGMLTILNFFRDKKKDRIEEFEKIIEQWKVFSDEMRQNEKECEERYDRLHAEFLQLKEHDIQMTKNMNEMNDTLINLQAKIKKYETQ